MSPELKGVVENFRGMEEIQYNKQIIKFSTQIKIGKITNFYSNIDVLIYVYTVLIR